MSFVPVKTAYDEADMNRLNRAPQKICGFYEQKGSFQPVFDQSLDSGFSEGTLESGPPVPPKLLGVDHENYDSGAYMEEDIIECDRASTVKEEKLHTHTPLQKSMENLTISSTNTAQTQPTVVPTQKPPRRPRVNYSVMAPASNTNTNSAVPTTVQAGRPTTSHNVTYSTNNQSIQSTRVSRVPISLPAQRNYRAFENVRRRNERNQPSSLPASVNTTNTFAPSTSSNWPAINIFELQQNVQYFLPNREGDT